VLLEGGAADERTLLLIQLLKSCNLVSVLYEHAQRKPVNARIDQATAQDVYSNSV
jgi:hypothetical protein